MQKRKVLIIEDSKFTADLIQATIEKMECEVTLSYTPLEGLERVKSLKPDLVILDVIMPGMDGFEVCRTIKKDPLTKHIPIMMLTVKDTLEDLQRGFQAEADYYMTKPFIETSLINNVKRIFEELEERQKRGQNA